SFPEASLLSQHQCLVLAPPGHLELPGVLSASASEGQSESGGSEPPRAGMQEGSAPERLLCPVCQEAFAQPGELKEHFRLFWQHRKGHAAEPPAKTPATGSPPGLAPPGLQQRCVLLSGAEEGQEDAGNCHSGWEATTAEARPAKPPGAEKGSLEGRKASAGEEDLDSGRDSPEEDGETPCKGEAKDDRKAAPEKARVPQAQHFKGDVAEGSENLYKTHMCPECKRCFKKRTHLVEHLHLHFPDPSLQCPNCHKYFTSKSKLKIHMMRETGEKAHRCPLCHYSSVEKNALNRHMASMHEDISNFYSDVYSCPVCAEKFRLSQALKEHLKTHKAEPNRLSCFQGGCDYCAEDRKEFVRHLKDAHGIKAVECKYHACSLLFGTAEAMEAHRKTHYAFHCQQCDFICSNKHVFRKHKKQGHPGSEQLQCSFCPYATFNPVEFHDHVGKMHANEKIHKCTECAFATAHKRVLIRHMLLHTGEKPHKCELCDFTCRDVSYLSKHMLTHSDDKNFMCTECGYITKWKHYLNVHMRKHTGDLRYQCNQCSYRCHRADQLSSHKLRHQGKSLICEVCGFACKRKYELQKHMQANHSQNYQVPIFQCQYCTYQTKYKQALLKHENCKHTKQKEFRCALCSYCTFSNTSLFFHKRKIHGYVPGDKDWLENYASKELEISSSEALFGYELSAALRVDASSPLAGKEQWAKAKPSQLDSQGEGGYQQAFVVPLLEQEAAPPRSGSEADGGVSEEEQSCPTTGDALGNDHMQGDTAAGSTELAASGDVTESCTLHLEALNVSSDPLLEHLTGESCTAQPESMEMLSCKEPPTSYKMLGSQDDLSLEDNDNTLEDMPDFEEEEADVQEDEAVRLEDNVAARDSQGEDTLRDAMGDLERSCADHHKLVADTEMRETSQVELPEAWLSALKTAEQRHPPIPKDAAASSDDARGGSESVLKALRKQDKEQAETLVLEGRVQMLVVQSESQIFKCEKCSYITRKEKSMSLHSKASCQSRRAPLVCHECGTSFKQQRGLNTHLLKKCPVLLKKNKILKPAGQEPPGLSQPADQPSDNGMETAESNRGGSEESRHAKRPCEAGLKPDTMKAVGSSLAGEQTSGCPAPEESLLGDSTEVMEEPPQQVDGAEPGGAACPLEPGKPSEKYRLEAGKLHCNACSFVCSRVSTITSHVEDGCRSLEQFWCSLCPEAFRSQRALKSHCAGKHVVHPEEDGPQSTEFSEGHLASIETDQPSEPPLDAAPPKAALPKRRRFSCPTCPFTCHQERAMKTHKKRGCVALGEFRCASCPFTSHGEKVPSGCPHCGFVCHSEATLKCHLQKQHPHLECSTCKETFATREALEEHKTQHFSHRCELCSFAAKERQQPGGGKNHEPAAPQDKPLRCPFCDFTCRHQLVFDQHMKGHGGTRVYKCSDCEYTTKNRQKITWHIRIHTGEKPYKCHLCKYACADPSRLQYHMRIHKEERKYLCPDCGYKCKWVNQLKYHMTKHTGLKPYRCDECEYRTNRADALRVHKETRHREARSFICEQCGKAFKTRFLLKTHLKKHSEEKPYVCNTCGRAFRWAAGLRHPNEHPFFCRYCSYKAKQKFQVIKHIQRHHPERGAGDLSQGVGKDPSTPTVHLHTVQRESRAEGPPRMEQEAGCPAEKDAMSQ
ncbi:PREDICTED: zinc finger protein 142, partial [Tauraco erythrolophus]|uniref:zinc finger protein 142 n=1 Tax=Tauraco erythrolophus TaxID=121530 RepID=UPI0005231C8C